VKKRLDERFATAAASFGDGGESSRSHGEEIAQPTRGATPAAAGTGRPAPRAAQRRRESLGSGAAAEIADVGGRVALEQGPSLRGLRLDLEHRHGLTAAVEAVAPMRHAIAPRCSRQSSSPVAIRNCASSDRAIWIG
jgi:hypothetical protein